MQKQVITILETSDIHGHVLPLHYGLNQEMEVGVAKVASLIKKVRAEGKNTILIDNGDVIQGSPLAYYCARIGTTAPNPMVKILDTLGYDAAVLGNHEFNYGQQTLDQVVRDSSFPWLSANVLAKETGEPLYGQPYIIREYEHGLRVGVLGITTQYIPHWEDPKHIEKMDFADPVTTAKKWVTYLREIEQVDLVVVSYHGGLERDIESGEALEPLTGENQGYQICEEVAGIDVLLTGHQHRDLIARTANDVLVVQPGNNGRFLAKITVTLDQSEGRWKVTGKEGELLAVEGVPVDAEIVSLIQPYEEATQTWLDQPIGVIEGDMLVRDPMEIRTKKHAMIQFINRVQMDAAGVDIASTSLFDNYAPGFPNAVTMRDIVANYIYPNTLKVLRLSGQDIKDALEHSASYFAPYNGENIEVNPKFLYPKPEHYNYDMWDGIEYRIDISRPIGERITRLSYHGSPLQMDGQYDVVMNNYRASGGGNYHMFQGKQVVREVPTEMSELIVEYITRTGTVKAEVEENWSLIHD
ncbi:bifunctional UDP-sugar hydrolase/5'-nucleotidase [Mechercharimyces sp. CAU 1602]|uniref:bifunctional metallophosphatase/5'-nucleotidase n=1 Tax=Mechercharimyces sp. CAU 1602 TaxID=2973933 RepID=UPI002163A387|nr:bifunctional UDP-sugar hydrolase/5'-nucleotidase [Mechercharimyces sp. CAU 1602]MCS1352834.1 bifunctional metallophosphatase/5'-nucleotidase [Mechercharimyces sp. CAU 1602]